MNIEDKNGKVIYRNVPQPKISLSPSNAFKMVMMLREGVRSGTSRGLQNYNIFQKSNQIGGKTGTTQNSADGWYFGITDDIVCGVWVGGEDKNIHFSDNYTGRVYGQGAKMSMPIFAKFLENCYKNTESGIAPRPFKQPEGLTEQDLYNNILCTDTPTQY